MKFKSLLIFFIIVLFISVSFYGYSNYEHELSQRSSPIYIYINFAQENYTYGSCIPIYFNASIGKYAYLNNTNSGSRIKLAYIGNTSLQASHNVTNFPADPQINITSETGPKPGTEANYYPCATIPYGMSNTNPDYVYKWNGSENCHTGARVKLGYYLIENYISATGSSSHSINELYIISNREYIQIVNG